MRALVLIHRWLGVVLCLFFAMWFASGMVMHFVPFPSLDESERVAGLIPFNASDVAVSPREALKVLEVLEVHKVRRMRLAATGGTPAYVALLNDGTTVALDATSGRKLAVNDALALSSARAHARRRGLDASQAHVAAVEPHDQWSVPNSFDAHRPLYRVALGDAADTMLYVSSVTGENVLDTSRAERAWNWAGSVLHWVYPTALRQHWRTWDAVVWWLSLAALTGAVAGAALGLLRFKGLRSPFRGWMRWHHWLGLGCALFVLTWIFSGWLSMDHGRLFSNGAIAGDDRLRVEGRALSVPDLPDLSQISTPVREMEWFPFAGQVMVRVINHAGDREVRVDTQRSAWLTESQLAVVARALGASCTHARLSDGDAYPARAVATGAPVYRVICGATWFHIDGTDGRVIERLDTSRRAYRWAFQALHTLDFPVLTARPALRTVLIVVLCATGFAFSVSGVVIAWRRLRRGK